MSTPRFYLGGVDYEPGDVANGHVLGADGRWHQVSGPQYLRLDPRGYWARYLRRWKWSALAFAVLCGVPVLFAGEDFAVMAVGGMMMFLCGGLFMATLVNFVVAAFPTGTVR